MLYNLKTREENIAHRKCVLLRELTYIFMELADK